MKTMLVPLPCELEDINHASGSFFSIYTCLKQHFNVILIGPLKHPKSIPKAGLNILSRMKILPWKFPQLHSWSNVESYAEQIHNESAGLEFDLVFATSTLYLASFETTKPKFAFTDFSFFNALEYYPYASNVFPKLKREAIEVDKYSFENHTKIFLASEWSRLSTIKEYQLPEKRVSAVGRGANLVAGLNQAEIKKMIYKRIDANPKYFLFVGVDWSRKGGEITFQIVMKLRSMGLNVGLTIIGCSPPKRVRNMSFVQVIVNLNRKKKDEIIYFKEIFQNAFIFILPTKAEAMGIVFAEASSFGLPLVAFDTGGVGEAVLNNDTGFLFSPKETVENMALKIETLFLDSEKYFKFSLNAFKNYQEKLNWSVIMTKISNEISEVAP